MLLSGYNMAEAKQMPFSREVFWLKIDGSQQVKRIAHHHSDLTIKNDSKDYFAEPHATSSWDGTVVLFASIWGKPWERYDLYTVTGNWWK